MRADGLRGEHAHTTVIEAGSRLGEYSVNTMSTTQRRIIVYTAPACPYCVQAKRLLTQRGIGFHEIDVAADAAQRQIMMRKSGRRTVPQIFIDEEPIGGYEELAALDRQGGLADLAGHTGSL